MNKQNLNVEAVAELARISLTPGEVEAFGSQLGKVLEHIEFLNQVDISEVDPTAHASPVFNVLRPDEPRESLKQNEVLALAPHSANALIVVPKVVE